MSIWPIHVIHNLSSWLGIARPVYCQRRCVCLKNGAVPLIERWLFFHVFPLPQLLVICAEETKTATISLLYFFGVRGWTTWLVQLGSEQVRTIEAFSLSNGRPLIASSEGVYWCNYQTSPVGCFKINILCMLWFYSFDPQTVIWNSYINIIVYSFALGYVL